MVQRMKISSGDKTVRAVVVSDPDKVRAVWEDATKTRDAESRVIARRSVYSRKKERHE